jgi:hypothetical protein
MALGSTEHLADVSTWKIPGGEAQLLCKDDHFTSHFGSIVINCRSLKMSQPYGTTRVIMETVSPLTRSAAFHRRRTARKGRLQQFSFAVGMCSKGYCIVEMRRYKDRTTESAFTRLTNELCGAEYRSSGHKSCSHSVVPSILWNPKVNYRVRKSSPTLPILSQTNQVHNSQSYF